MSIRGYY